MHRIVVASFAAIALGGCGTAGYRADFGDIHASPRDFFNLNAPVRIADASVAGTTVALKEGHALILRLPEDAAAGTGRVPDGKIEQLVQEHFDLRPKGIIQMLKLLRPIYRKTAAYGHFGRDEPEFTWEATDKAQALKAAAGL